MIISGVGKRGVNCGPTFKRVPQEPIKKVERWKKGGVDVSGNNMVNKHKIYNMDRQKKMKPTNHQWTNSSGCWT